MDPIKTEAEYLLALEQIERLWDFEEGALEAKLLNLLIKRVEAYEEEWLT